MTIRDFLNAKEPSTHRYEEQKPRLSGRFGQRFVGQLVVAVLIFAAIVYCYDQENQIGEGVRTIVAMATADDQNMLAVNGDWAFPWQSAQEDGVSVAENQPRENLKDD